MENEIGIIEKIKSYTENMNIELFITTIVFMILGFIYFIFRLRRLIQPINIENEDNHNNINNNENMNNQQNNINNENNNINNNNNERIYHITIQIERDRHNFEIKLSDNIGQFVRNKIFPLTNNRDVYLFYQGQILNQSQPFSFYEHRITENMVIVCKIRENNNYGRQNNNHYNDNINEREQEQLRNDPRSVSIYSIFTHLCIIMILGFIIFSYKKYEEIFTQKTKRMIQFLCIIWALSFSNSATKLIFYKKISY